MNLKLKLICALLFCFSFFNMIGQTETLAEREVRLMKFVTKNDPSEELYRKELYINYLKKHLDQGELLLKSMTEKELESFLKINCDGYYNVLPSSFNNTNNFSEINRQLNMPTIHEIQYAETYCMKITKITYNELGDLLRMIDNDMPSCDGKKTRYGNDDFFECCVCIPQAAGGVKVPPLFLVGEAPCSRGEFLERVYKYYAVKRREPEKWIEVINSKNTNGETILDFFKTLETHGNFNTDETRACAREDIKFICEHGGVHAFGKGTKEDYCECLKNEALEKKE